jgi:flagellar biosynthesis/type III secretory pathway M-ring protein FliF/YscJ
VSSSIDVNKNSNNNIIENNDNKAFLKTKKNLNNNQRNALQFEEKQNAIVIVENPFDSPHNWIYRFKVIPFCKFETLRWFLITIFFYFLLLLLYFFWWKSWKSSF